MTDQATIQAMLDKQAITEALYNYCRSMDRRDIPLGHTVFHEDSYADYGDGSYRGSGRGFIDYVAEEHLNYLYHSHQITNILIDLDGDRAGSEAYVTAVLRFRDGEKLKQLHVLARYIDRWSKRDGHWAIDNRYLVTDLDEIREVSPRSASERAHRGPSDPSYEVLRAA
jgi:hypothetical protein